MSNEGADIFDDASAHIEASVSVMLDDYPEELPTIAQFVVFAAIDKMMRSAHADGISVVGSVALCAKIVRGHLDRLELMVTEASCNEDQPKH